jgi:uncharacterized membrane protein YphA (DoxX/SURF4 family)
MDGSEMMRQSMATDSVSRRFMAVSRQYTAIDIRITAWLARYGITILRVGLGLILLWFGLLKFVPGVSAAEDLAGRTIEILTFGVIEPSVSVVMLAVWESVIGLGLVTGRYLRVTLLLLILQMLGTLTPLVFFPAETFTRLPYAPTLEGQYIIKNVVLIGAGLVIGATARGGRFVCDTCPETAH